MKTSENIDALTKALVAAQAEMKNAAFDTVNSHFKNRYASLAAIRDAVVPILAKNDIAMTQTTETNGSSYFALVTRLTHASGQWIEGAYPLAVLPNPQAMGSALTYARRYALSAICGIAADEDEDAEIATKHSKANGHITPEQLKTIQAAIMEVDADIPKFLKYMKTTRIEDLPADRYQEAMSALEAKRKPKPEAA